MTTIVAIAGILVLIYLSVLIGAAMDTEVQRDQWKRVARERRKLAEERRAVERGTSNLGRCANCPLRDL